MRMIAFLLTAIAALSQTGNPSLEKEAALGKALANDFRSRVPSLDDPDLPAYVMKIVARLDQFARSPFPVTAEISGITDGKPDIVALPGGYLFVPVTMLATAQNEADFARAIAHALADISIRQPTRPATSGLASNPAPGPVIFMGGWGHDITSVPLAFRKIHQEREAQAGRLADEWLELSGFANGTFDTGEFFIMRDRARVLSRPQPKRPTLLR